ncbi:hypothetical protein B0H16DRAFT_1666799 [Mycena metata]|uniref:Short-chain dehydrogenase/reductase SDR n=1 Tax=Mycena metata TaxID=1033252 RepID=A0AAD7HD10_9AGAR|nr:hypothetical protein B0H16DRAFT_1666799 [Mycena metata]
MLQRGLLKVGRTVFLQGAIVSSVAIVAGLGNGSGTGGAAAYEGYAVALISWGSESLNALASSIKESGGQAHTFPVPPYGPDEIAAAFSAIHEQYPSPEYAIKVAIFNIGQTVGGPFLQLTAEDIRESNQMNIESSFALRNEAATSTGKGTLVFTGATASVRGNVTTSGFASGKFAVRALAQSLAKEFGKEDIHLGVATGNVRGDRNTLSSGPLKLSPESITAAYLFLVNQDRAAWTWELDLRPAHEKW